MVIASIQPSTFSPLTVKPLSVTASTLPWKVYDFAFPFALSCAKLFAASKHPTASTPAKMRLRMFISCNPFLKLRFDYLRCFHNPLEQSLERHFIPRYPPLPHFAGRPVATRGSSASRKRRGLRSTRE